MSDAPEKVWRDSGTAYGHMSYAEPQGDKRGQYQAPQVEYVRKDIHDALVAERDALKSALDRIKQVPETDNYPDLPVEDEGTITVGKLKETTDD